MSRPSSAMRARVRAPHAGDAPRRARSGRCRRRRRCRRSRPRARPASSPRTASRSRSSRTCRSLHLEHRRRPGAPAPRRPRSSTSRPTISSARLSLASRPPRSTVATFLPRRSTEMRSATSSTSSSLWVMRMIDGAARRAARAARRTARCASCGVSTAVGSSRISTLRVAVQRLEDLGALLLADADVLDARVAVAPRRPYALATARARALARAVQVEQRPVRGSAPSTMFSATVITGISMKCWCTMPMPSADGVGRASASVTAPARRRRSRPRRAGRARRGSSSASTCRRRSRPAGRGSRPRRTSRSTASLATTRREALGDAPELERQGARRSSFGSCWRPRVGGRVSHVPVGLYLTARSGSRPCRP